MGALIGKRPSKSRARHGFCLSQKRSRVLVFPVSAAIVLSAPVLVAVRRPVAGPRCRFTWEDHVDGMGKFRHGCDYVLRVFDALIVEEVQGRQEWRWILSIAAGVTRWSIALRSR